MTTSRSADDELAREHAAQLREAQRIAGIGSWEHTLGSDAVSWSEGLQLILRRDPDRGPPEFRDLHELYPPDSWERLQGAIAKAIETGAAYELELEMIRADRTLCWTTTRGEAVRGPDGALVKLRGTVHDITERKRAEKAYEERAAQLREAQRIAGIGSWEYSLASGEITWSEGLFLILQRDLGLSPPSFADLPRCYTPGSWARLQPAVARTVATGEGYELELEMLRQDGTICWTTTRGEAVRGPGGAIVKLRGTVHDITERRAFQAAASQADRLSTMGLLAAGVAHEVNNPLAYVLHNVQSLAKELPKIAEAAEHCAAALRERTGQAELDELLGSSAKMLLPKRLQEAAERAQVALEGSERIKVLIRSLGTFSRVEQMASAPVDLRDAIESAMTMAHNEIRYRATVVKELADVPAVWASEGKLSQVFLNLIINAAHSIDEGHVEDNRITIRTWATGADVFAEVADTGKGIAPEHLEHIFEPFFSTKQIGKGSGLGLAICRNLVTEFGGDIRVESGAVRGTRFVIRLPVQREQEASSPDPAVTSATRSTTARGRVLVVDDEPEVRKIVQHWLEDTHDVVAVPSAVAGRQLLERDQSFDVVLCDLMMPEMTGMELHEWLTVHHPALSQRVVFITGGIFTPRAAEYLAKVDNVRLQKPFEAEELLALVARLAGTDAAPT